MSVYYSGAYPAPNAVWQIGITMPLSQAYTGARVEMNPGSLFKFSYAPYSAQLQHLYENDQPITTYLSTGTTIQNVPAPSRIEAVFGGTLTINGTSIRSYTGKYIYTPQGTSYHSMLREPGPTAPPSPEFTDTLTLSGNIVSFTYYVDGVPFLVKQQGDNTIYGGYSIDDFLALSWTDCTPWLPTSEPAVNFYYPVTSTLFLLQVTNLPPVLGVPTATQFKLLKQKKETLQTKQPITNTVPTAPLPTLPVNSPIGIKTTVPSQVTNSRLPYYGDIEGYLALNGNNYSYQELGIIQPITVFHGVQTDINGNAEAAIVEKTNSSISYAGTIDSITFTTLPNLNQTVYTNSMNIDVDPLELALQNDTEYYAQAYELPNFARSVMSPDRSNVWYQEHYFSINPQTNETKGFYPSHPDLDFTWNSTTATWNSERAVWGMEKPVAFKHAGMQGALVTRLQNPLSTPLEFTLGSVENNYSAYDFTMTYAGSGECTLLINGSSETLTPSLDYQTYTSTELTSYSGASYTVSLILAPNSWVEISSMAIITGNCRLYVNYQDVTPIFLGRRVSLEFPLQTIPSLNITPADAPIPPVTLQFLE